MPRESRENVFRGYGVEIELPTPQDFLKIRETLTRIGTRPDLQKEELVQVCHILHKRARYAIMHYSELMALDGSGIAATENELLLRNAVAWKLDSWGLANLVEPSDADHRVPDECFAVVPYRDKERWNLTSKYFIGKKR